MRRIQYSVQHCFRNRAERSKQIALQILNEAEISVSVIIHSVKLTDVVIEKGTPTVWLPHTVTFLRLERSRNFCNRARIYDTMFALVSGEHRYH